MNKTQHQQCQGDATTTKTNQNHLKIKEKR